MNFDKIQNYNDKIVIKNVRNFELEHIFECGQCFRWEKQDEKSYIGIAKGKVIEIEKGKDEVIIYNSTEEEFKDIWCEYFDLYRDYSEIKKILSEDPILKSSVEYGNGMRILKQDPFELVISFIISANNRIPMIKRAIKRISEKFGEPLKYKGKVYYTFPTLNKLHEATLEDLELCGTGFRAKYIKNTVDKIYNNTNKSDNNYDQKLDLNWIKTQEDDVCHKMLQNYSGVGPKVADCIMLFSMQKYTAFPVDVWVKRAMQYFYVAPDVSLKKIRDFGIEKFGELAGFAQQYLFYYARENKINVSKE